jgi:hypothetical protein
VGASTLLAEARDAAVPALLGAALCFGIRMIAIVRGWQLPAPPLPKRDGDA